MNVESFVGRGFYTIPEASRLTRVNASTLRRWLQVSRKESALGFLELIEARSFREFRKRGVRWSTLRAASKAAQVRFRAYHPFATFRLIKDGRAILQEVATEASDKALEGLIYNQGVFERFMRHLIVDLDFEKDIARRWWPLSKNRDVVLDPQRAFGRPIVNGAAIPTSVLARAVLAEGSIARVAHWYELSGRAVQDAVDFERLLTA